MPKRTLNTTLLAIMLLILSACQTEQPTPTIAPTATQPPTPASALISEVMVGLQGNNNYDFIELYNPGDLPLDLNGYTLSYQLDDDKDAEPVHEWNTYTVLPPHGHYLLARAGEDFDLLPDARFSLNLVTGKGGLSLVGPEGTVADSLTWGSGPTDYTEGNPAPKLENGSSLERAPGGESGNGNDSDNNSADFALNTVPTPQNSGSPVTPALSGQLGLTVSAPETVDPGTDFTYTISIHNTAETPAENVHFEMSIPDALAITTVPASLEIQARQLTWEIDTIPANTVKSTEITVTAPWTYTDLLMHSYFVQAAGRPATYGGPLLTSVANGAIPIEIAKTLVDEVITVEGIATMYTGGYYAGSGNTKFYMEDETGGLQVWVDDGEGDVTVPLGARVRVQGELLIYRGAYELAPTIEGVVVLEPPTEDSLWPPTPASIGDAANNHDLAGLLVQVEGTVARVEEFSYSYEIDLIDAEGQLVTLYVDKLTEINVETIESGQKMRAAGVLEALDERQQLYPRVQTDLQEIYPEVLMLEIDAPTNVEKGEVFTVSLTATNHTLNTLEDLYIEAQLDAEIEIVDITGNIDDTTRWEIASLPGEGESVTVSFDAVYNGSADGLAIHAETGYSGQGSPASSQVADQFIFFDVAIPIWAIQGPGDKSPYVLEQLEAQGVVTGVFPELGGFWIQSVTPDDNPATSEGLFINTSESIAGIVVQPGDLVQVAGRLHEAYQQTQLVVTNPDSVEILDHDQLLPNAIELDPPSAEDAAAVYYEALEGMLVQVTTPAVAVSPSNQYGEYSLVLAYHDVDRLLRGGENGIAITVDDGSSITYENSASMAYTITTGDRVTNLAGPLAYTYGQFKIEPLASPTVTSSGAKLPSLQATAEDEFSLMTWNVENLFDIIEPNPSDPPIPSLQEYRLSITKVANTILAAGTPTIVGLQEVENIGILEDIAEHELLAGYDYQPVLIEGTDSRGIDVGYLVRGDVAQVVKIEQFPAPAGLTSRPPLMVKIEVETSAGTATLYVLNNHFTSMSGGEQATEPRRVAQAAWNVEVLNQILADDPGANVAVIGDLNSFYDAAPIETLRAAGLEHVFDLLPPEERYSYIYEGVSQTLDHIMTTSELFSLVRRVEVLHVNADFPPPEPGDESPQRKSDHDPVVVIFSLTP